MHGQFLAGLQRLGHEIFYAEKTTTWPWHPARCCRTDDPAYPLEFLVRTLKLMGLSDHWAYRPAYADRRWHGPLASQAVELIRSSDAVFNISRATTPEKLGIDCHRVYIGADPVIFQLRIANGSWRPYVTGALAMPSKRSEFNCARFAASPDA